MARYRLIEHAFLDGVFHKAGSVIERPDDWQGPTRSVPQGPMLFQKERAEPKQEPLFERVEDKEGK